MKHGFFLTWEADPIGVLLGTGFYRFDTPFGISGLARLRTGGTLDVLAVIAEAPGKGQFRKFIDAAKATFNTVSVWEDWNPIIGDSLSRYGFHRDSIEEADGERNKGWSWPRALHSSILENPCASVTSNPST
jgi:hypothetical protein